MKSYSKESPSRILVSLPAMSPINLRVLHRASSDRRASAAHGKPLIFWYKILTCRTDESERVFKVQCGTFEHFYYAFEFHDYIACPAFLVSLFKLTDYACLDVSNDSHYYYIFLSRKDAIPNILDKQSNFRGKFELKIPSEAHKLLPLNPKTKDFKGFIFSDRNNIKLCDECVGFSKSSDSLMKSKVAPSYWFVSSKLKELFKANHPLFTSYFVIHPIFVHEDSNSFVEFQEIMKPITKSLEVC